MIAHMKLRPCPVCGSSEESKLFAEANVDLSKLDQFAFASRKMPEYMHWRLWLCGRCDLVYASPAPAAGELASLYQAAAFGSSSEAHFASRTYARILRTHVVPQLADLQGALDIGTGDGAFLHELLDMEFSDVLGMEPSSAPIEASDARVRPLIRPGLFQPNVFAADQFRVVTCFQTIEHVPDPLALCREAWRILKPEGALVLIGHNRRALSAKLLGGKSPIFDIEHLQLFSPISFRRVLSSAGFTSVSVFSFWNRYPMSYWAQLFPFPARLKSLLLSCLSVTGLGRVTIGLPAGNLVAIGFKHAERPPS